ncbi:MAG: DUF1285 domain-containing protein [Candidatus Puniceispirillaceae bacterium]
MSKRTTPSGVNPPAADLADKTAELQKLRQPVPQEFDIRIAADGSWYHEGGLIGRPALVKLFSTVLRREKDGSFWLVTPVERGSIEVEDAPFVITVMTMTGRGEGRMITFRTNVDDEVRLGPDHPLVMRSPAAGGGDQRPYVMVRDGLEALVARPVFYELAEHSVAGPDGRLGVWSCGAFFALEGDM